MEIVKCLWLLCFLSCSLLHGMGMKSQIMPFATKMAQTGKAVYRGAKVFAALVGRPGHVPVFMDEIGSLAYTAADKRSKKISTNGLCGCVATVLHMRQDHLQRVLMTHFSRLNDDKHAALIIDHLKKLKQQQLLKELKKVTFLLVSDERMQNDKDERNYKTKVLFNQIQAAIMENIDAEDVQVHHLLYENHPLPGKGLAEICVTLANQSECALSSAFKSQVIKL